MGSVFGRESVKEPPHDVVLQRGKDCQTSYELRHYSKRYAASVEYSSSQNNAFRDLARYIGVFGTPENQGTTSIAMTAPVVMEQSNNNSDTTTTTKPESIAMTAPVVMEEHSHNNNNNNSGEKKNKMMFMLPEEYNDRSKIPKPTNPAVTIDEIPSEWGVVHRYNGNFNTKINRGVATRFGEQLMADEIPGMTQEHVLDHFQFWGYNPPFTIPYFKRNEIWVKLNEEQVSYLKEKFGTKEDS
mmetsp:Transcript_15378/g.23389  ORF Transcript_15378/g.23389 Transcript_15378/m.23389 type:complete len:242 (-) Transcript_15378:223-948(-)|eukprot:CAMPEP_0178924570 /NCGR_PEP_ID=MMETSP0786-20121207/17407_1 /TAXON_ID=186022 /ORGANISM="Thalassionema frauenfeldii, Strain CCMP 1798" /LENGTH=241 /DNA_ID=CAMNT_0020599309 /DNA_START=78 /DNA_END=803 /DNA_ORIENTATION=+